MKPHLILVIEDDPEVRESLVDALEDEGHRILAAIDGIDALEKLEEAQTMPDLILLDLMMPRLDGFGFREAQLQEPRWAAIPVVVLTADRTIEEKAARLQPSARVRKPVKIEKLLEVIQRVAQA